MRYSPKSIANYFLELAEACGQVIDPMKLQKLVYYAHGWFAGYRDEPLINETVEAWPYGPVIQSLYHEFKRFGSSPIRGRATEVANGRLVDVPAPVDAGLRQFLDNVWASYGQFSGLKLSEMTHAPGGPWEVTRNESNGMRGVDIPFERIKDHFKSAIATSQARAGIQQGAQV